MLTSKWVFSVTPPAHKALAWCKRNMKTVKARGCGWLREKYLLETAHMNLQQLWWWWQDLSKLKPEQSQHGEGSGHEVLPLAEGMLAINSFWNRESMFKISVSLVSQPLQWNTGLQEFMGSTMELDGLERRGQKETEQQNTTVVGKQL